MQILDLACCATAIRESKAMTTDYDYAVKLLHRVWDEYEKMAVKIMNNTLHYSF